MVLIKNLNTFMTCHSDCAACCIYLSISPSPPFLPDGKKAYQTCPYLTEKRLCSIWNDEKRPDACKNYSFSADFCGANSNEAHDLHRAFVDYAE